MNLFKNFKDKNNYDFFAVLFTFRFYDVTLRSHITKYLNNFILEFFVFLVLVRLIYIIFSLLIENFVQKRFKNSNKVKLIILFVFLMFVYVTQ